MRLQNQQIRYCNSLDGINIAYTTIGQGPPLVRVATYMTHLDYDYDSPVWHHWLRDLSRENTLVRYDQRGCGLSDRNVKEFSMEAWINDLDAVVNAQGLERFALLGPSQGGAVAINYAVRYPEKVTHLILYGSYIRGRFRRKLTKEQRIEANSLIDLMQVGWGKDNPAFRQVFSTLFMPEGTEDQIKWFNDLQRISTSPENAARIERAVYNIDISDVVSKVSVPTMVLHSRGDAMIPFEEGRRLAGLIPNAIFVPLQSKNHLILEFEPAWQHFLNALKGFIKPKKPKPSSAKYLPTSMTEQDLTSREMEILELIARGLNNAQIAQRLFIASKTVRNHITNIYSKLNVANRAQAIVKAREAGLGI
ncbi:MAG: alpha/beta fold hydrolase [Caldithrix sp.]|nr:alpha/beta fold hydrolase [Caldithrix sp.]